MIFNLLALIIAIPIFCAVYFAVTAPLQRALLLVASIALSATFGWVTCGCLLIVTGLGYGFGRVIARVRSAMLLATAVTVIVAPLVILKYTDFFLTSVQAALAWGHVQIQVRHLGFVLPVGLSFYTFVVVGYLVDVFVERIDAESSLARFALFTSFFPKFVAGPVERADSFLPQVQTAKHFDYARVTDGIRIMGGGLLKKVVVADRLAVVVDSIYHNPEAYRGLVLILATVFYMFQLYYDFCGYSELAVGAARVLGYDLTWNFNRPYAARSVTEYWRRWHISLTSWFFEYIFAPIAALLRRSRSAAVLVGLMATFIVSGLWHGAQWTFVLYGVVHGTAMCLEYITGKPRKWLTRWMPLRLYAVFAWFTTFAFLDCVDVLFRSRSVPEAGRILRNMLEGLGPDLKFLFDQHFNPSALKALIAGFPVLKVELVIAVVAIACIEAASFLGKRQPFRERLLKLPTWQRWAVYYAVVAAIVFLGSQNRATEFVYMRF